MRRIKGLIEYQVVLQALMKEWFFTFVFRQQAALGEYK